MQLKRYAKDPEKLSLTYNTGKKIAGKIEALFDGDLQYKKKKVVHAVWGEASVGFFHTYLEKNKLSPNALTASQETGLLAGVNTINKSFTMAQVKNRLKNEWTRNSKWGNPEVKKQTAESEEDEKDETEEGTAAAAAAAGAKSPP